MPIPIIDNGPNTGKERKRVQVEGGSKPPKLRKKHPDAGAMRATPRAAIPVRAGDLEDYDEDKP